MGHKIDDLELINEECMYNKKVLQEWINTTMI